MPSYECLRTARRLLGWTQAKSARLAGVRPQSVCDVEAGRYIAPITHHRLVTAYERAGIVFVPDDVKLLVPA